MNIFTPIWRWFEEHASAAVQAKHIAFLKEQFTTLEKQYSLLQKRLEQSEAKTRHLEAENENLRTQIQGHSEENHAKLQRLSDEEADLYGPGTYEPD